MWLYRKYRYRNLQPVSYTHLDVYKRQGYHRNGKGYCSSHRIHEEILDKAVWNYTEKLREQYAAELKKVTQLQKQWALRKPVLDAHCSTLQKEDVYKRQPYGCGSGLSSTQ